MAIKLAYTGAWRTGVAYWRRAQLALGACGAPSQGRGVLVMHEYAMSQVFIIDRQKSQGSRAKDRGALGLLSREHESSDEPKSPQYLNWRQVARH